MLKNTTQNFGLVSKLLHWVMALVLAGLYLSGDYMVELDYYDSLYHTLPWWHKSIGLFAMSLLIIRVLWKGFTPSPHALASQQAWEVMSARVVQVSLYLIILLLGVTGYLIATAKGKAIDYFNWFELPALLPRLSSDTADLIGEAHALFATLLVLIVALHAIAALKHHFIDKDDTLKRMV